MQTTPMGDQMGFSLIEWLIVVAITATLMSMAATPLVRVAHGLKAQQRAHAFMGALWLARAEAARHNSRATLCTSTDLTQCDRNGSWANGWLLFIDHNHNGQLDTNEPVIRRSAGYTDGWRLTGNGNMQHQLTYLPAGYTRTVAGAMQMGTLTLCPPPHSAPVGKAIVLNSLGRPRLQNAPASACL